MDYFNENPPSSRIRALSLIGIVIAVGFTKVIDYDIWWHLISGELIFKWRQILPYDIFSYTAPGTPWINHEWLYQVGVWLLLNHFGIVSITILKLVLTICITWAVYSTFKTLLKSQNAALWGTIIMIVGIGDRIMDRPFLFSILFTTWFILELYRFADGARKSLWALPIAQIVWINLHGAGILGPEIVLAFALGESLQSWLGAPSPLSRGRLKHLWLVGFACLAACAVNPYGIDVFLLSFSLPDMRYIMMFTQEWIPALDERLGVITSQVIFRIVLVLIFISYLINRKEARFSHLALTAVASILVLNGRRFTTDFVLINLPIIFFNLRGFARSLLLPVEGHFKDWFNVAAVSLVSIMTLRYGVPITITLSEPTGEFGTGAPSFFAPAKMVDFLETNDIHGRMFNEMGIGAYLMFRRWPRDLVFLDGRTPIYGDEFYRKFIEAFQLPKNFDTLDEEWHFDYLVFGMAQAWEQRGIHTHLWNDPKWKLVYADASQGLVYVKDEPRFKDVIEKFAFKNHPMIDLMDCIDRSNKPYTETRQ